MNLAAAVLVLAAVWPLNPRPDVVHGFDPPTSAWGAGHRGVDLAGTVGETVRSTKAGTVTYAGTLAGRGVVVVRHGATRTTYEPVSASVRVGDRVAEGQPIGRLQWLGSHCFPRACLHWGLLRGETYLDPLMLVGGGPIRLLPMESSTPSDRLAPLGRPAGLAPSARLSPLAPRARLAPWLRPAGAPFGTPLAAARW